MIDISSGAFYIAENVVIRKSAKTGDLIDFLKKNKAEKWDVRNGWVHYYLKNYEIDDNYFFFDFMFYNDVLSRFDFNFYPALVENTSWDNWSEEKELQKKAEYEEWLNKETGGRTDFPWGAVAAYFDSKSGGSGIMINYDRG